MEWLSPDTIAAGHIPVDGDWIFVIAMTADPDR